MRKKARQRIRTAAWTLLCLAVILLVAGMMMREPRQDIRSRVIYREEGRPVETAAVSGAVRGRETVRGWETVRAYDVDRVMRIITAEAGSDLRQCRGVSQALYNACERLEWQLTPEEVCGKYRYTHPADYISQEARTAFMEIFSQGETFADIGGATMFYNPLVDGQSRDHEEQQYVCSIGDVRYFVENG